MAADVVGYSKKMGENEERTLRNLKSCRAITDKSIDGHHGRIFHTAGDSVIAEFASPVDAVLTAVEFQKLLQERNAACETADQIQFRVGVNLGDVIVEGDNLFGAGINIAARIESIARPGGICVSHSVFSEVRKKLSTLVFASRGRQSLKNIEEAIEVFDISDSALISAEGTMAGTPNMATTANRKPIVLVESLRTTAEDGTVVMLASGLVDGIVSSLMKSTAVAVIRQVTGDPKNPYPQVEAGNQISFKVTGSIQSAGSRLRIFITLENALTGTQIWSKRFDKSTDDIFDIQDEIAQKINLDIRHKIKEANFERLETIDSLTLSVPELLDKAAGYFVRVGRSALEQAGLCVDLALQMEPHHSMALSMRAQCVAWHQEQSIYPIESDATHSQLNMLDLAIKLDPRNYFAITLKAECYCYAGAYKDSVRTADAALRIFPDFDQAKAIKALSNFHLTGDITHLETAKRLRYFYLQHAMLAWFSADVRDKAIELAELIFEQMAGIAYPELCAAAVLCAYTEQGPEHSRVSKFVARHPELHASNCRRPVFVNTFATARFDAGLLKLLSPGHTS